MFDVGIGDVFLVIVSGNVWYGVQFYVVCVGVYWYGDW